MNKERAFPIYGVVHIFQNFVHKNVFLWFYLISIGLMVDGAYLITLSPKTLYESNTPKVTLKRMLIIQPKSIYLIHYQSNANQMFKCIIQST